MPDIAFVNGKFLPLSEANVSVEDRGFQFGDGVYEVIRSYGGKLFRLNDHLERLKRSMEAIHLPPASTREDVRDIITSAYQQSGYPEAKVYLQVTRGAAPRDHQFPQEVRPTVVITVRRLAPLPSEVREHGVAVITVPDIRWGRCDIKSVNLLPNVLSRQTAQEKGAFEALFVRGGSVMEGAGSNLFQVGQGKIATPPKGSLILSGITRDVVIEIAKEAGMEVEERSLPLESLMKAEEVFLTGTTIEIISVVAVDGVAIGEGRPGKVARGLFQRYRDLVAQELLA